MNSFYAIITSHHTYNAHDCRRHKVCVDSARLRRNYIVIDEFASLVD